VKILLTTLVYLMGSEKLPSTCYILFTEYSYNIPFSLRVTGINSCLNVITDKSYVKVIVRCMFAIIYFSV